MAHSDYDFTFDRFKIRGMLIDTSLLLLLILGSFDINQVGMHKLDRFTLSDFKLLKKLITSFGGPMFVTTNILTEVCNHSDNFNKRRQEKFYQYLFEWVGVYTDKPMPLKLIIESNNQAFLKFGLTDATIVDLAREGVYIVTVDLDLYHYLANVNYEMVMNFTHYQDLR
jgi:hypothetical protein